MAKITRNKRATRFFSYLMAVLLLSTMLLFPTSAVALSATVQLDGEGMLGGSDYLMGEWVALTGQVVLDEGDNISTVALQVAGPEPLDVLLPTAEGSYSLLEGSLMVTVTHTNVEAGEGDDFVGGVGGGSIAYAIQWRPPYFLTNPDAELPDPGLSWEIPDTIGIGESKLPLGMTSDGTYLYILVDGALGNNDVVVITDFNGNRLDYYSAPSSDCHSIAYLNGSIYVYANSYRQQSTETEEPQFDGEFSGNLRYRLPTVNQDWQYSVVDGTLVVTADGEPVDYVNLDNQNGTFEIEIEAAWDDSAVSGPSVVKVDTTYYMYYHSDAGLGAGEKIGLAISSDGLGWEKNENNPLLEGTAGEWDEGGVLNPSVVYDGTTYHMWYVGYAAFGLPGAIGYATSADGITWVKDANNPVLEGTLGQWDGGGISDVTVIKDETSFELWYTAIGEFDYTPKIGYALNASGNGVDWVGLSRTTEQITDVAWGGGFSDPAWSSDDVRIAAIKGGEIYVIAADGSSANSITPSTWDYSETQYPRFENNDAGTFGYQGGAGWWEDWGYPGASGGVQRTNDSWQFTNSIATITFTGTEVSLRYYTDNDGGIWDVTIDGSPASNPTIDAYGSMRTQQDYLIDGLADEQHTLVLTQTNVAGTGGGYNIALDYADVTQPVSYNNSGKLAQDPVWHPTDANKLAFVSNITGKYQIFEVDVTDELNPVFSRVNHDSYDNYQPAYSPDGSMIAYSAKRDGNTKDIWGISRSDSWANPWRITEDWGTAHTYPAWSPNGETIIFIGNSDIQYVPVDVDGTRTSQWNNMTNSVASESHPTWSADGTQIVYSTTGGDKEVWVMDWNSENPNDSMQTARTLTANGSLVTDKQPMFSNDGAWVAYASDSSGVFEIWKTEDVVVNPVMESRGQWDFDQNGVSGPMVYKDPQGTYHIWYTGKDGNNNYKIGYANSTDGKSWNYPAQNPVLNTQWNQDNNWENTDVYAPAVISDTGFHMWYVGENDWDSEVRIGKAISGNGTSWARNPSNPLLEGGVELGVLSATYNYYTQDWGQNSIIEADAADGAYVRHFESPYQQQLGGLGSDGTFLYARPTNSDSIYRIDPNNPSNPPSMWISGPSNYMNGGTALVFRDDGETGLIYYANAGTIYELQQNPMDQNGWQETQQSPYNTGLANINGLAMIQDIMYIAAQDVTGQVYYTNIPGTVELSTVGDYSAVLNVNDGADISTAQDFTLNTLPEPVDVVVTVPGDGSAFYTPTIDIEGTVNDPSIEQVQVGIELPMIAFLSDDMDNADPVADTSDEFYKDSAPQDGWSNYSNGNLWNITDKHTNSGQYAWGYYNENGWGFNTPGLANAGAIVSQPFNIGESAVFSFWTSWDTDPWVEVDRKLIDINVGSGWEPLAYIVDGPWYHDPYGGTRVKLEVPMAWKWDATNFVGPQWAWYQCNIDLSSLGYENITDAQIRFRFDSMDDFMNDMEGWFLDDVTVNGSGILAINADVEDTAQEDGTFRWATQYELGEGQNVITVRAQSAYIIGDTGRDTEVVAVSLDTTVPLVSLDQYPSTNEGLVSITGSVNELNFDRMEIRRNDALISTITAVPDGQFAPLWDFTVDVPLVDGNNVITADIWDIPNSALEDAPGSDSITVIRDAGAPVVELLDTIYYIGEVSARRGDLFVFQVNVDDQGTIPSGVRGVEVGMPGGGENEWMRMIPASDLPESLIDAWGTTGQYLLPMVVPEDAATGNYEMECRATDNAGNIGYAEENLLGEVTPTLSAYNIYLMPEWNFFSLPLIPETADIETLMGDIPGLISVQYYDAASQTWQVYTPDGNPLNDDLLILEPGKGYWAEMDESVFDYSAPFADGLPQTPAPIKFSYSGQVLQPGSVPPTYDVYEGWNAIGLHSEWSKPVDAYLRPVSVPQQSWAALLQYDNYISVDVSKMFEDGQVGGGDGEGDGGSPYEIFLGSFRTLLETNSMNPADGFWLYLTQAGKLVAMP